MLPEVPKGAPGAPQSHLESSRERPGEPLRALWEILGSLWDHFGSIFRYVWLSWDHFEQFLTNCWVILELFLGLKITFEAISQLFGNPSKACVFSWKSRVPESQHRPTMINKSLKNHLKNQIPQETKKRTPKSPPEGPQAPKKPPGGPPRSWFVRLPRKPLKIFWDNFKHFKTWTLLF